MTLPLVELPPSSGPIGPALTRALALRAGKTGDVGPWVAHIEEERKKGRLPGLRAGAEGGSMALVLWDPSSKLGANIQVLYAEGEFATPSGYRALLDAVVRACGKIAFAPGPLAGLSSDAEEALMTGMGFARYGRSEFALPPDTTWPPEEPGPGRTRPFRAEDEPGLAEVHRRAYHDRFDRYLFLEDPDERRDSAREVRDLLGGKWGERDPDGTRVLEVEGKLVGDVIVVRRPGGVLIADVAIDPAHQGQGLGRRLLVDSLRALRGAGVQRIVLNVTEGNEPALHLYRRLGFVRSLGPSRDWFHTSAVPVRP